MSKFNKNITESKKTSKTNENAPSTAGANQLVSTKLFVSNVGDLGQGRLSFFRFLMHGISEEMSLATNPILIRKDDRSKQEINQEPIAFDRIYLYASTIKIKVSSRSSYAVAKDNGTYSAHVYMLVEYWSSLADDQLDLSLKASENESHCFLAEKQFKERFSCEKHYLHVAEIPFITEEGSFVINGCERVIISQIIRSPGIYFKTERVKVTPDEGRPYYKLAHTGTLISTNGRWTKIFLDAQPSFDTDGIPCNDSPYLKRPFIADELEDYANLTFDTTQNWSNNTAFKDLRKSDTTLFYLYAALSQFGLSNLEIRDNLKYPRHYEDEYLKCRDYKKYRDLELEEAPESMRSKESKQYPLPGSRASLLKEVASFYNPEGSQKFIIGKTGRSRINTRLDLNLPESAIVLTAYDLIAIINILLDFRYLTPSPQEDDIDHIKNKQVRSVGDLIQLRFRSGLARVASLARRKCGFEEEKEDFSLNVLQDDMDNSDSMDIIEKTGASVEPISAEESTLEEENDPLLEEEPWSLFKLEPDLDTQAVKSSAYLEFSRAFNPGIIGAEIKRFFTTSEISQFFDQINPISSITHKRRVSVFGPNGLQRDHVSIAIRDIHPSQYGRICPVETSEGHNAGLVTSLALLGQITSLGWIEAPYFYAENCRVFANESPVFLSPQAESELMTCFASVATNNNLEIIAEYNSVKEDYLFSTMKSASINFIAVSPLQILSAATTLIPFLEHNDANRVLMGANMQRQAVPLIFSQKPIVGTGLEPAIAAHSSMVVKSFCSGHVLAASISQIVIQDIASAQKICYPLQKNFCSNQKTSINQKPAVWAGEKVAFNQIISDGPGVLDGELSLGQNLLVAYMPWEGYNYEDAMVISQRLLDEDCLTSIHIEEYTTQLKHGYGPLRLEILTVHVPQISRWFCRHLDRHKKIAKIGSYVHEYDVLVGKKIAIEKSHLSAEKLWALDVRSAPAEAQENEPFFAHRTALKSKKEAIVGASLEKRSDYKTSVAIEAEYIYQNTSLCVPKGTDGKVIETRTIDFGALSRKKNASKLDTYKLGKGKVICVFIAKARKVQVGDKLAGRHGNKGIISKILASRDMPHLPDGTPIDILLNPLGVPSRMNVGQVFEGLLGFAGAKLGCRFKVAPFDEGYGEEASRTLVTKKLKEAANISKLDWVFSLPHLGKTFLKDGRTGEYFDNPITIGKSYILKLIHMADDKVHARATGPYAKVTEQPLAGKAREGGQRFGEMEAWALEAFGCSNVLQELFTVKSDDIDGRNEMYSAISLAKPIAKPSPVVSETYLVLVRELNALGLEFLTRKIKNSFGSLRKNEYLNVNLFETVEVRLKLRQLLETMKLFTYV